MYKNLIGIGSVALAINAQAALVYESDFSTDPNIGGAGSAWNINVTTVAGYDSPNQQVDYTHTAGTTRRFLNHVNGDFSFASTQGYMKAEISNFLGDPSVWIGFVEDNAANNANYTTGIVGGNGTYELVVNNSAATINFDNGAGWSGTLAAGTGLVTTDGGSSTTALTFGAGVDSEISLKGFGFANFGNGTVFPTSSFSIDSIVVHDSASVPEPSGIALIGLGLVTIAGYRRRRG